MKNLFIYIFSAVISFPVFSEETYLPPFFSSEGKYSCESTNNYIPVAKNIESYEWSHITKIPYLENQPVSTYIYSSNKLDVKSKAVVHFCSRFAHHMIMRETTSLVLDKKEPWFNPLMSKTEPWSDSNCQYKEANCLFYTVILLKDKKTNYEIPIQIELLFDNQKSLDMMFEWVKTLNFKYKSNN